jgi:hypothetical protein
MPEEPQRRSRSRSASIEELEPTEEILPPPSKIFRLDRTRSRELRGWMTSQLKSAESKQIREDFFRHLTRRHSIYRYPNLTIR